MDINYLEASLFISRLIHLSLHKALTMNGNDNTEYLEQTQAK